MVPPPQPYRPGHYFETSPTSASAPSKVDLVLSEGRLIHLVTDRGVFSGGRVDPGTRVLLAEAPPVKDGGVLADVGCGYGPIAMALAVRAPTAQVWAVDVNERARELCKTNAQTTRVAERVHVVAPEEVPSDLVVDEVWSNPPIRIGKEALHSLLLEWLGRLRPGTGRAHLVVQKHLGADSLQRWLVQAGWPTDRIATRGGYRVLSVSAPADPPAREPTGASE